MTIKKPALSSAEEWLRREASENPQSICARVLPEKISVIAEKMQRDMRPDAADHERAAWLMDFEVEKPVNFVQVALHYRDASGKRLSADDLLALANCGKPRSIRNIIPKK
jgi:hypothetical protein